MLRYRHFLCLFNISSLVKHCKQYMQKCFLCSCLVFIRHKLVEVFDKYIVIHKCFFSCKIFSYRHLPLYLSPIHVSFLHQLAYPSLILHFHRLSVKGLSHLCIILLINRLGMVSFFIPKYININILNFSFLVYCFTDTRNSIPEQSNFCAYRLLLSSIL